MEKKSGTDQYIENEVYRVDLKKKGKLREMKKRKNIIAKRSA